ncbi:sulfite exporter TauE/SafE family protein [Qipengyuania flava]|uniref:sulfite exporter TauE/SafE family protein n=1 Tax=Qipengyuania flava TaxID=192812 RepID=UPI001C631AF2|nr:sulfite exporter TauE/SafE family protein [Qipengyuania flava]QYJ07110.1 sulfite exporter TauE/SafE family protein [Qipengyuania flava]
MEVLGFDLGPIVPFILIGFLAQMVDGALGMAFGVITNTLMVGLLGVPPALASQRVHLVECFTTATSGISHLLHGNIDKRLFFRLLIPGVIGGLVGSYLLTAVDGDVIKPFVLIYLAAIGVWLLVRGLLYPPKLREAKHVAPLGLVGGFLDSAGGGGWGPVVTSNLLVQGAEPRKVVGTVNSVEFFLTLTISASFAFHMGISHIAGPTLGLIVGGIAAAPFGAMAAKHFSPKLMLVLVGVALSATSAYGIWTAWG